MVASEKPLGSAREWEEQAGRRINEQEQSGTRSKPQSAARAADMAPPTASSQTQCADRHHNDSTKGNATLDGTRQETPTDECANLTAKHR